MKDAKSMYRGGDIVEAIHCDFDSSRLLGLVCPFCNEAVYLRAGTSRIGKSKISLVNPSFCHYPGSAEDLDCERRSLSAEGRREIERIKTEKRGQRLELYNKHLWDMIVTCVLNSSRGKIVSNYESAVRKGKMEFIQEIKAIVKQWASSDYYFDRHILYELKKRFDDPAGYYPNSPTKRSLINLISRSDNFAFHFNICNEVYSFLASRTSGFTFRKLSLLVSFHIWIVEDSSYKTELLESSFERQIFFQSTLNDILFLVPWEAQIERFLAPDRRAADEKYYAMLAAKP